jgi:hypothetical protein
LKDYTQTDYFIKAMTVFPVTEQITSMIRLMAPIQPPPFPTTANILADVITQIKINSIIRENIQKAIKDTLIWLRIDDNKKKNIEYLQTLLMPFQTLQLIGRVCATSKWLGFEIEAQICEQILSKKNLAKLKYKYIESGERLLEHIQYVQYEINKILNRNDITGENPLFPISEYNTTVMTMSEDDEDENYSDYYQNDVMPSDNEEEQKKKEEIYSDYDQNDKIPSGNEEGEKKKEENTQNILTMSSSDEDDIFSDLPNINEFE